MELPKLISQMSDSELFAWLQSLREKREKAVVGVPAKNRSAKMSPEERLIQKLRGMTPEQIAALRARLGGEK